MDSETPNTESGPDYAITRTGEPITADFRPDGFKRVECRNIVTRTRSSTSLSIRKAGVTGYSFQGSSSAVRDGESVTSQRATPRWDEP